LPKAEGGILLNSWMEQYFRSETDRRLKTLNKIYRLLILQVGFQNVGTVVVKVFKGSKKIEFKKSTELWSMAKNGFLKEEM